MKRGTRVKIYHDPITVSDLDDSAIAITTPKPVGDTDCNGQPLYSAIVEFADGDRFYRKFSEPEE